MFWVRIFTVLCALFAFGHLLDNGTDRAAVVPVATLPERQSESPVVEPNTSALPGSGLPRSTNSAVATTAPDTSNDQLDEIQRNFGRLDSATVALYDSYTDEQIFQLMLQDDIVAAYVFVERSPNELQRCRNVKQAFRHGLSDQFARARAECVFKYSEPDKNGNPDRNTVLSAASVFEFAARRGDYSVYGNFPDQFPKGFEFSADDLVEIDRLALERSALISSYRSELGLAELPVYENDAGLQRVLRTIDEGSLSPNRWEAQLLRSK